MIIKRIKEDAIKWKRKLYIMISFSKKSEFTIRHQADTKQWRKRFLCMAQEKDDRTIEIMQEFLNVRLEKISKHKIKMPDRHSPILVCVIKNDKEKIQLFMEHYRKLGIEAFVFIDNMSTDGTREYLCDQKDTICLSCSQEYSSARRVAWINRAIARIGDNRWYLVVDSDEFISYIAADTKPIKELVNKAELNQYKRIEGFLLDMYSNKNIFDLQEEDQFIQEYRYFDTNSYKIIKYETGSAIVGGPRARVFRTDFRLSKYPLFFFSENDIIASSHYMRPQEKNYDAPIWLAICHYKFITLKDYEKVCQAVQNKNYSNNSADYKAYLKKIGENNQLSFYNVKISEELTESSKLEKIRFLRNPFAKSD